MGLFRSHKAAGVDFSNLPRHIAIIMDGNGRWAKVRGLPRAAGHSAGAETFRRVATYCRDIGLPFLTVFVLHGELETSAGRGFDDT
jgi:undecaprenyl diphosphate synthase